MAATIKDIAKRLNISISTVSYALNNGPRPVPEHVRERVLEVAKELDYRPNRIARLLNARRAFSIGIVPAKPDKDAFLSPHFQQLLNGMMNVLEDTKYAASVFAHHSAVNETEFIDSLTDGRVDALLFSGDLALEPIREAVTKRGLPSIALGADVRGDGPVFNADNYCGVQQALLHLKSMGHRRIAYLGGPEDTVDGRDRNQSFHTLREQLGLDMDPALIGSGKFVVPDGEEFAAQLLKLAKRPTAIFCANDEMAIGVCKAAYRAGLSIPRDWSVVGFDDYSHSWTVTPSLTTVHQPVAEMSAEATRALIAWIESDTAPESRVFPTSLVIRESSGPATF